MSRAASRPSEPGTELDLAGIVELPDGDGRHQLLARLVSAQPSDAEGHLHLGLSYLTNRFSATLALPVSVVVLGGAGIPTHASPEEIARHLELAEEHFRRAIELDPGLTVFANPNIAAVRMAAKEWDRAIAHIEELIDEGAGAGEPLLKQHLGTSYRENGQYEAALELFNSLVDHPELTLLHRNLALTYLSQGRLPEADEQIQAQLGVQDSHADRLLARGIAAELRGDPGEARSAYEQLSHECRYDGRNELLGLNAARRRAAIGTGLS